MTAPSVFPDTGRRANSGPFRPARSLVFRSSTRTSTSPLALTPVLPFGTPNATGAAGEATAALLEADGSFTRPDAALGHDSSGRFFGVRGSFIAVRGSTEPALPSIGLSEAGMPAPTPRSSAAATTG
ncbi:hypothetical protein [Streptomyces niveus]|uniref:hypothetical protein n=1 Tax=Streptomyces niveus TaxID=193462 RepID=UPI003CFEDAD1